MLNYNTEYICTYTDIDIFLPEDNISEDEKQFVLNCLYRNDLLYIFNIEDFEKEYKDKMMNELFEEIKENDFLLSCVEQMAKKYKYNYTGNNNNNNNSNMLLGVIMLYSYDFLHVTHPCVSEYLEKGEIRDESMKAMKEKIHLS
jgi:hypothetical protein